MKNIAIILLMPLSQARCFLPYSMWGHCEFLQTISAGLLQVHHNAEVEQNLLTFSQR
jgi:hypothetical protein